MFTLAIRTTNDAYQEGNGWNEIAGNLNDAAAELLQGATSGQIRDVNGNHVGEWEWKGDEFMAGTEGYNGWTNYETWAYALWMNNEEPSYNLARDLARAAIEDADNDGGEAKLRLSETLKSGAEDERPELGASVWADLLTGAMSEINWFEIASNLVDEVSAESE